MWMGGRCRHGGMINHMRVLLTLTCVARSRSDDIMRDAVGYVSFR